MNKKAKHRRMTSKDNPIITAAKRGLRDGYLVILGPRFGRAAIATVALWREHTPKWHRI